MTTQQYIDKLNELYSQGVATEHSYRGDLQSLLETLIPDYAITNEPRRSAVGAPDYIVQQGDIVRGYIEAKDIDINIRYKVH